MLSSRLARNAKDAVLASAAGMWELGFAAAGRLTRHAVEYWSSPSGQRVLVIAPHPDDEAVGCAGTIIRHRQSGDSVWVAVVTDGRRSGALGLGPEEMAARRRQEAESCAEALGIDRLEWFGLPEGEWSREQLQAPLATLLDKFAPDVVYAPSLVDFHPDHRQVAHGLALLLPDAQASSSLPRVRVYQVHVPLTPTLTNLVADISGVVAESTAALNAYVTQSNSVARTIRQRRYAAQFYGIEKQAEEFWQMGTYPYRLLHHDPPDDWPVNAFRGIRFRSLSDPLAYLKGLSRRRRLAGMVRSSRTQCDS